MIWSRRRLTGPGGRSVTDSGKDSSANDDHDKDNQPTDYRQYGRTLTARPEIRYHVYYSAISMMGEISVHY